MFKSDNIKINELYLCNCKNEYMAIVQYMGGNLFKIVKNITKLEIFYNKIIMISISHIHILSPLDKIKYL